MDLPSGFNSLWLLVAILVPGGLVWVGVRIRRVGATLGLGFWEAAGLQLRGVPLRDFMSLADHLRQAGLSAPIRQMIELHRRGCNLRRCVAAMLRAKEYGRIFPLSEAAALDLAGKDPLAEIERGLASRELDFPGLL